MEVSGDEQEQSQQPPEQQPQQGARHGDSDSLYGYIPAPPPAYGDVEGHPLILTTLKFPPVLDARFPWPTGKSFHMGTRRDERLLMVETRGSGLTGTKPTVIIHDGPAITDPILATSGSQNFMQTRYAITLPSPDGQRSGGTAISMSGPGLKQKTYRLAVPKSEDDGTVVTEDFEWRSTSGIAINELTRGSMGGWKLVRLTSPSIQPGTDLEAGYTSDGKEVVALMALNRSLALSPTLRFSFAGSGLTGFMGAKWEIIVLASALQVWDLLL
ncbi:hypothetical protein GQ53DRAFT_806468 [Thozetella sp. PMI_491]|nr:hypothetical protein GQ53DRAFT_806468 [Thozetella sp. PMI_491]